MADNDNFQTTSYLEDLCATALAEQDFFRHMKLKKGEGNFSQEGLTKSVYVHPFSRYYIVSLKEEPVGLTNFKNRDPNIRSTCGQYIIKYMSKADRFRRGDLAYSISQDLVHMPIYVSGPQHWHAACDRIPELKWLERNSTLTDSMFALAKKHPGLVFRFTIKFVEYAEMIENKAVQMGIDIDHKPFMSYVCSKKAYQEKYSTLELAEARTKADYMNVLNDLESRAIKEG